MNLQEKFKIWDATSPTVTEVKAYLNRLCGKTPLTLVYKRPDGKVLRTDKVETDKKFIGIMIEDTVFFARGFTRADITEEQKDVCAADIRAWTKVNPEFPPFSYPVTETECLLLAAHREELDTTVECLAWHNLSMPRFSKNLGVGWLCEENTDCRHEDGDTCLSRYLEMYGDIWICNSAACL